MQERKLKKERSILREECIFEEGYPEYFLECERPIQVIRRSYQKKEFIKVRASQCRSYYKCSDYAIAKKWLNFFCGRCPTYFQIMAEEKK